MLSSCACAPVRNPPPGLLADAKTRHAVPAVARAAARVVSAVTSSLGLPPGGGDGSGAPGG